MTTTKQLTTTYDALSSLLGLLATAVIDHGEDHELTTSYRSAVAERRDELRALAFGPVRKGTRVELLTMCRNLVAKATARAEGGSTIDEIVARFAAA